MKRDPVDLIRQLQRLRLHKEAITVLANARLSEPERQDLRDLTEEFERTYSFRGRIWTAFHLAMFYVLALATLTLVLAPPIHALTMWSSYGDPHEAIPLWQLLLALVTMVLLLVVWNWLFLHTWFFYLKRFCTTYALQVERCINSVKFEPHYSAIRRRYLE